MLFTWKRTDRHRWHEECDLMVGKIRVASIMRNIGSKGSADTFRLVFLLPQIRESDVLNRFEIAHIDEMKKHAESVCQKWFDAATTPDA